MLSLTPTSQRLRRGRLVERLIGHRGERTSQVAKRNRETTKGR
jgi:hypothetical protein